MEHLSHTILEKIRNTPRGVKYLVAGTSLALLLTFTKYGDKQVAPKKLGDFDLVDTKKEDGTKRNIYKYTIKKGDYPFMVSKKFNEIDQKNGDIFQLTKTKNILDENKNEVQEKQIFHEGDVVYIKAEILKEKESKYVYTFSRPDNYGYRSERENGDIEKREETVTFNGKKGKVVLLEDAGLTFYVVQEEDFFPNSMKVDKQQIENCIDFEKIRNKLSQIDDYSYLEDNSYERYIKVGKRKLKLKNKLSSFNINPKDLEKVSDKKIRAGKLRIPLPIEREERMMEIQEFGYYAQQAIEEMKTDSYYASMIKELLSKTTKEEVLEALLTYAYCESSPRTENELGAYELHRREGNNNKSFSFSYFHVLMKPGSPGFKARNNLNLSEGECYNPKNATKLFLGFWAEKAIEMKKPLSSFFPLNANMYEKAASVYNGKNYKKNNYDTHIKKNHKKVLRLLKEFKS